MSNERRVEDRATSAIDYIQSVFVKETSLKKDIEAALEKDTKLGINVSAYEGRLLQFLMRLRGCKAVLEIGTLYGYSTLWMAEALPSDGRIVSLEVSSENHAMAKELLAKSPHWSKIDLRLGEAEELLGSVGFQPDFVFIDADKGGYRSYLDWAMENVAQGGLIVGDNTFLFGHVYGKPWLEKTTKKAKDSMAYFNETLAAREDFEAIMLPTVQGLTVGMKL